MSKISFEEYLAQNGTLTYVNVGISMLPMLKQGRDVFTVVAKKDYKLQKYDVILYKRPPDKYVLHRIIEVRANDYVVLGDNCVAKEYIREEDILGVLTEFVHKGKRYTKDNSCYRIYTVLWCKSYSIRMFFKKIKGVICSKIKKH